MKTHLRMFGGGLLLAGLLMVGGCGSGSDSPAVVPPPVTTTSAVDTTKITAGTVANTVVTTAPLTVTAPANAPAAVAKVEVAIPTATVITAKDASGTVVPITAPKIVFSAPGDATATTGGTPTSSSGIKSAASIINIAIEGVASATFSNPVKVTVPFSGAVVGSSYPVYIEEGGKLTNKAVEKGVPRSCQCIVVSTISCDIFSTPTTVFTNAVPTTTGSSGGTN